MLEGELQREVTDPPWSTPIYINPPTYPLTPPPLIPTHPPSCPSRPLSIITPLNQVRVLLDAAARRHGCGSRNEGERRFSTCSVM